MKETFEEFMNSPEEVQRRLNSYMYRAWAERFNTTVEMIDRVVQHGENISYQGIDYEYCDVQADIIPSFRANSIRGIYSKPKSTIAKLCSKGMKVKQVYDEYYDCYGEVVECSVDSNGINSWTDNNYKTVRVGIDQGLNHYRFYQLIPTKEMTNIEFYKLIFQ